VAEQRRMRRVREHDSKRDRPPIGERTDRRHASAGDRPSRPDGPAETAVRADEKRSDGSVARRAPRDRRRGAPWWIWASGLLLVGVVAFMIFQGASDTSADVAASGGEAIDGVGGSGGATAGTVASDGVDLLALSSDPERLRAYEERSVEGASAPVESVVGDEAFWVGDSDRRLLVFLNLAGESGAEIDAGDEVTFSGRVKALPVDYQQRFDVSPDEGAGQLEEQGRYIEATEIDQR
jgi:hypothetical protein